MPLNDNDFDQLFRDRLRNHSSPVRGDLWRRIHTGLSASVRHLHLLRYWRFVGAGAAIVTVAFVINHYSTIPAANGKRDAAIRDATTRRKPGLRPHPHDRPSRPLHAFGCGQPTVRSTFRQTIIIPGPTRWAAP